MPKSLSTSFEERYQYVSRVNEYKDGSSTRKALHDAPRKKFTLAKKLTIVPPLVNGVLQLSPFVLLRNFYAATRCGLDAFYFYNYREGDWDEYGLSVTGRYTVVFRGGWTETVTLGDRTDCNLILEEVE